MKIQINDFNEELVIASFKKWLKFKFFVQEQMQKMGLDEVETPTLVLGPAFEDQLEVFETNFNYSGKNKSYFLPTSPEIHLKKLLVLGFKNIFEIRPCFRNNELSNIHEPEFTMLEWYRVGKNLLDIEQDVRGLFDVLVQNNWLQGEILDFYEVSISELFMQAINFHLSPETQKEELLNLAKGLNLNPSGEESKNELFEWIFVNNIEPFLNSKFNRVWIVHSYPPWYNSLTEINKEGWASRFEIYFRGMEIANAFYELTNYEEHERKWKAITQVREKRGLKLLSRDEIFFNLIKRGLPRSSGIALGLERLFMAFQNFKSISDFKPFTFSNKI
jgi:lysyl-tRNA synthetase class 2